LEAAEPLTVNQFVPKPVVRLLVCDSSRQPMRSTGQKKVRLLLLMVYTRLVGVVLTAAVTFSVALLEMTLPLLFVTMTDNALSIGDYLTNRICQNIRRELWLPAVEP